MPHQLVLEESFEIVQDINFAIQLAEYDAAMIKEASSLREQSRDLRRKSESLRSRNVEVMNRACAIALHCYVLNGSSG